MDKTPVLPLTQAVAPQLQPQLQPQSHHAQPQSPPPPPQQQQRCAPCGLARAACFACIGLVFVLCGVV
eukprot:SAG22_NODE_15658_length_344_cov_0.620408_1_plen_67_part_01